jgi:hypothetical protein
VIEELKRECASESILEGVQRVFVRLHPNPDCVESSSDNVLYPCDDASSASEVLNDEDRRPL